MRAHLISVLGFAVATALAVPACTVSGQGTMGVETTTPIVYQEPPPPQVETVSVRPGFSFIKGRWDWRNGQWTWVGGHWERERAGQMWAEGRWERQNNAWHWVEGTWSVSTTPVVIEAGGSAGGNANWNTSTTVTNHTETTAPPVMGTISGGATVTISGFPTAAPPPPRVETYGARAGFVWIIGRWDWKNGQWAWVDGHWERERANQMWISGRWELSGNRWVWVDGRWDVRAPAPAGPVVRDHR